MSDFPKRNASFNPNAYRSQAAYDAHLTASRVNKNAPKPGNASNPNGYRGHAAQSAYQNHSRGNNNNTPKNKQFLQKKHATQKAGTSSNEAVNTDKPHFMTDEEVRQWFREAEADYERDKKAGKYDSLVPSRLTVSSRACRAGPTSSQHHA
ncbi:hypothetical protein N0V85_008920 [Neurospora sp. IMI 360204]|nr:hypothetical protein N0V85_008920 [Neurospora sp. IMI 360204]